MSLTQLKVPAWHHSWIELTLAVRKAITQAQLVRWVKATRAEKGEILDAVCAVTGWHRDHARKAIRIALGEQIDGPGPRRQTARRCAVRHRHLDGIDPAVIAQVRAMPPATIDRRSAPTRTAWQPTAR